MENNDGTDELKEVEFDGEHSSSSNKRCLLPELQSDSLPLRKRVPNHVFRENCNALPENWLREVTVRKNGIMINSCDISYISPTGKIFNRKAELVKHFGDSWDLDGFDFKTGKINETYKKWIKLKAQHYPDLPPFEAVVSWETEMPSRQTDAFKMQKMSITDKGSSSTASETNAGRTDNNQSKNVPCQVYWHKRLEGVKLDGSSPVQKTDLDDCPETLLCNKNIQSIMNASIANTGSNENLDPSKSERKEFSVNEEDILEQAIRLREARIRLANAVQNVVDN